MKWQYMTLPTSQHGTLDVLGNDGWELVAVDQMIMFLKRRVEE